MNKKNERFQNLEIFYIFAAAKQKKRLYKAMVSLSQSQQ